MNRRQLTALLFSGLGFLPKAAHAQTANKVPSVGVLSPGHAPPGDPFRQAERFEGGLRELGWQPGSSIAIHYRYAEGKLGRLTEFAEELVRLPVDVIIARGQTLAAARAATAKIAIVMAADPDPVGNGFISSFRRPGGNVTGLTTQAFELEAKQLELLRVAMPTLRKVAVLTNASNAVTNTELTRLRATAAQTLEIELLNIPIGGVEQLGPAFARISEAGAGAILISGTLWFIDAKTIAALALEHHLASITNLREFAEAGALMTYGVSFAEVHRRSASYVDKILKGANPAELPVEQPSKFDVVINLKTAASLGLTIPPSILIRADEVIE